MKKQHNYFLQTLNSKVIETLTNIVDETLANNYEQPGAKKTFTAAELWNIQKQRRTFVQRRYC